MENDPMFPHNFRRNISDLRSAISNLVHDAIEDSWSGIESLEIPQRVGAMADRARQGMDEYFGDDEFPKIDIRDTGEFLVLSADLPGVDPDDIEIEVGDDVVALSGIAGYETDDVDDEQYFYSLERYYGTFERVIPLPALIDPDEAVGEIKHGTLVLTLPKMDMDEVFEFDDEMMEDFDEDMFEMVPVEEGAAKKKPAAKKKKPAVKKAAPKKKAAKKPAAKKKAPAKKKAVVKKKK